MIPEALLLLGTDRTPTAKFDVMRLCFPAVATGALPEKFCRVINKGRGEALAIFALCEFLHIRNS